MKLIRAVYGMEEPESSARPTLKKPKKIRDYELSIGRLKRGCSSMYKEKEEIDVYHSTQVGSNKIYDNPKLKRKVWGWMRDGEMSDTEIQDTLRGIGHRVAKSVVSAFRSKMLLEEQDIEDRDSKRAVKAQADEIFASFAEEELIRSTNRRRSKKAEEIAAGTGLLPEQIIVNDGILLDSIIAKGNAALQASDAVITPLMALKAIELKRSMLGKDYMGQTVWGVREVKAKLDTFIEVVNKHVDNITWENILTELENIGWDTALALKVTKENAGEGNGRDTDVFKMSDLETELARTVTGGKTSRKKSHDTLVGIGSSDDSDDGEEEDS